MQMQELQQQKDTLLWRTVTRRLRSELDRLSVEELAWIEGRVHEVSLIQERLHALFLEGGGPDLCGNCGGDCCDRGKYHVTLVNLLALYLEENDFAEPDFSRPCPFLSERGCRFSPAHRPFNCVTFLCEEVENRLSAERQKTFYALEKSLRTLYEDFDRRFAASSLRGILLRCESLGGRPLLGSPAIFEHSI